MRLLSPAWIIIAGVALAHASGALQIIGTGIQCIDQTIGGVIDLRRNLPLLFPPKPVTPKKVASVPNHSKKVANK